MSSNDEMRCCEPELRVIRVESHGEKREVSKSTCSEVTVRVYSSCMTE
jgi:hypothetical protein